MRIASTGYGCVRRLAIFGSARGNGEFLSGVELANVEGLALAVDRDLGAPGEVLTGARLAVAGDRKANRVALLLAVGSRGERTPVCRVAFDLTRVWLRNNV
jgi:hypothetical protein